MTDDMFFRLCFFIFILFGGISFCLLCFMVWSQSAAAVGSSSSGVSAAENRSGAVPSSLQEHNQKRVVVVGGETTANKRTISTGSSEYQLQFAWPPSGVKNISNNTSSSAFSNSRRMPESLDSLLNHSHGTTSFHSYSFILKKNA